MSMSMTLIRFISLRDGRQPPIASPHNFHPLVQYVYTGDLCVLGGIGVLVVDSIGLQSHRENKAGIIH